MNQNLLFSNELRDICVDWLQVVRPSPAARRGGRDKFSDFRLTEVDKLPDVIKIYSLSDGLSFRFCPEREQRWLCAVGVPVPVWGGACSLTTWLVTLLKELLGY